MENNKDSEDDDLSIGGVLIGENLRSNSIWSKVATIAAVIAAIASIATLIVTIQSR